MPTAPPSPQEASELAAPKKTAADNSAMKELKRALKEGTPGRLYVFHGEETYLR